MPRIPKKMPFKKNYVHPEGGMYELSGKLPSWTLDARRGYRVGYYPDDAEITPIQGPMLPARVEARRQAYMDTLEDYREVMKEMAMEQAYNRKVAAWNEYQNLPEIERRFWANKNQIRNDLMAEFQDSPYELEDYMTSYRGPYDFVKLNNPEERFNYFDYPMPKSFDDFPEYLADMPWRKW